MVFSWGKIRPLAIALVLVCVVSAAADDPPSPEAKPAAATESKAPPTRRERLEAINKAAKSLNKDFGQFSDVTRRIRGWLLTRALLPHRKRSALFIDLIGGQGIGKSSYVNAVSAAFGDVLIEPYTCSLEGEVFLPADKLLALSSRKPDPIFGIKAIYGIEEVHRVNGMSRPPDEAKIRKEKYDATFRLHLAELKANWEAKELASREARKQQHLLFMARLALKKNPAPAQAPAVAPAPQVKKGPNKKQSKGPPDGAPEESEVVPEPKLVAPVPPELVPVPASLPDEGPLVPPATLEIDADKFATTAAEEEVEKERKKWKLNLTWRQYWRDATSADGKILIEGGELAKVIGELRNAADTYGLALLAAKEDLKPKIAEAEAEVAAEEAKLKELGDAAPFEKMIKTKARIDRLTKLQNQLESRPTLSPGGNNKKKNKKHDPDPDRDPQEELGAEVDDKDLNIDQILGQILVLESSLQELPNEADLQRYEAIRILIQNAKDDVRERTKDYEQAVRDADKALTDTLKTKEIGPKLIKADPDIVTAIVGPVPREDGEKLLRDESYLARRITKDTERLVGKLLDLVEDRSSASIRRADGIIVFANGNFPEWDAEVEDGAANKDSLDSIAESDEALRRTPKGRALVVENTRRILGRLPTAAGGVDTDESSFNSRFRAPWWPRRRLDRGKWEMLIEQNLQEMADAATAVATEDYEVPLEFVIDDTVRAILLKLGANANSDVRSYTPILDELMSAFWDSFSDVLEKIPQDRSSRVVIRYNPERELLEAVLEIDPAPVAVPPVVDVAGASDGEVVLGESLDAAAGSSSRGVSTVEDERDTSQRITSGGSAAVIPVPGATRSGNVIAFTPFSPNQALLKVDSKEELDEGQIDIHSHREMARILMGTAFFATYARVESRPGGGLKHQPYWDLPRERFWMAELATVMIDLAVVHSDIRYRRGQIVEEIRELREGAEKRLLALQKEFNLSVPENPKFTRVMQLFNQLSPKWFHQSAAVNPHLVAHTDDNILLAAEAIAKGVVEYHGYMPVQNDLVLLMRDLISGQGPEDPQSEVKRIFLENRDEFHADLMVRLDSERVKVALVSLPPASCDFTLMEHLATPPDMAALWAPDLPPRKWWHRLIPPKPRWSWVKPWQWNIPKPRFWRRGR